LDIELLLHLSIIFKKPPFEITDEFVKELVHSFFDRTSEEYVYVPLEGIQGFPLNYKIGNCNIITYEELPDSLKKHILHIEKDCQSESLLPTCWIYTKLDSVGPMKQQEEIYFKVEEALSILRIASVNTGFSRPLFVQKCHIYNSKTCMPKTSHFPIPSHLPYWEKLGDKVTYYSGLFYKEGRSVIENTVVNALKIYSLHVNATSVDVKFILVMFALEGLLLTENDRDYLGKKLSEKATFLSERDPDNRKNLYRKMKTTYSKRSNFVHQKKKTKESEKITSDDVAFTCDIFIKCIEEILSLEKNGTITKLSSDGGQDDNKSLDYYIENMIFS